VAQAAAAAEELSPVPGARLLKRYDVAVNPYKSHQVEIQNILWLFELRFPRLSATMNHREHTRHEEQRSYGRKHQSPNYSTSQGSILLTAFAQSQGHRQHSNNHRQRCH
jgi:hypothetical protein